LTALIYNTFKEKHPKIFNNVEDKNELFKKFNQNKINKADIALILSQKLEDNTMDYKIPDYIQQAFDYLMED